MHFNYFFLNLPRLQAEIFPATYIQGLNFNLLLRARLPCAEAKFIYFWFFQSNPMNLSIFFEPLNEDVFAALNEPRTLGFTPAAL